MTDPVPALGHPEQLWRHPPGVSWRRSLRGTVVVDREGSAALLRGRTADVFVELSVPRPVSAADPQLAPALDELVRAGLVTPVQPAGQIAPTRFEPVVDVASEQAPDGVLWLDDTTPSRAIRSLVRWGLDTGPSSGAPPAEALPTMVEAARSHRVVSLLGVAARTCGADLSAPVWDAVASAHQSASAVTLGLEVVAVEVSRRLRSAGVEHRLLKGAAVADASSTPLSWRDVGDVDVLVQPGSVHRAVSALHDMARPRSDSPLGVGYDDWSGKSVTLRGDEGWEVDLHRTLAPGPWSHLVRAEDLWDASASVELRGDVIPTLTPTLHLCHALIHAALGDPRPRLQSLRDIALLWRSERVDRAAARDVLDRWNARAPVRRAEAAVLESLGVQLGLGVTVGLHPAVERSFLAAYTREPRRFGPLALLALTVSPRDRRAGEIAALWSHYSTSRTRPALRRIRGARRGRVGP